VSDSVGVKIRIMHGLDTDWIRKNILISLSIGVTLYKEKRVSKIIMKDGGVVIRK